MLFQYLESQIVTALAALQAFDSPEDALNHTDPGEMSVVVNAIQKLVTDDLKSLITFDSVAAVIFKNSTFNSDLYAVRRLNAFFDFRPSGCFEAMSSMVAKILEVIYTFVGINNSEPVSQEVSRNLIMVTASNPMIASILQTFDPSWFTESSLAALTTAMSFFGQIVSFFGLKVLYGTTIDSIKAIGDEVPGIDIFLAIIALSVTNGATIYSSIGVLAALLSELIQAGTMWKDTCYELSSCEGEPNCDDENLCTKDRGVCDVNTNWQWECSNTPIACYPGFSCDPSDGKCKPDDILIPCIAVIDEDSSFGTPNQGDRWNEFRSTYQARPFCLLVPNPEGSVKTPEAFLSDGLAVVHFDVTKDDGDIAKSMDWMSMCGLNHYAAANVGWIGLFIDNSGSMYESEVRASRDRFYADLEIRGIQVKKVVNPNENWLLPFLTTLAPEDDTEGNEDNEECTGPEDLEGYTFWPLYDSEGEDVVPGPEEFSSLPELAWICDKDPSCKGFNTNGWLKTRIKPSAEWANFGDSDCQGMYVKKSGMAEVVLNIADAEIGVTEDAGPNEDKAGRIAEYRAAGLWNPWGQNAKDRGPEYWCMDFVSWVFQEAGIPIGPDGLGFAYVKYMRNWAEDMKVWEDKGNILTLPPQPADIIAWGKPGADEYHVGIVEFVDADGTIHTIEGNTGDGVFRREYATNSVKYGEITGYAHVLTLFSGVPIDEGPENECSSYPGYVFWPGYDSPKHDLPEISASSIGGMLATCNANPNCKGFNSNGYLKTKIEPLGKWQVWTEPGPCDGLFIKKPVGPSDYVVNGNGLRENEISIVHFIVKYTIKNMGLSPHEAIRDRVGPGAWWSLKEGVLNLPNPFRHNNCNDEWPRRDTLKACDAGLQWQVGVASVQVNYMSSPAWVQKIEDKAKELYNNDISFALSQTAKQALYEEETTEFDAILTSTGYLRTSWIFRNHLVGFFYKGLDVKQSCVDAAIPWCYDKKCADCDRYALENIQSVRDAIDEVTILLQSLHDAGGMSPINEGEDPVEPPIIIEPPVVTDPSCSNLSNPHGTESKWASCDKTVRAEDCVVSWKCTECMNDITKFVVDKLVDCTEKKISYCQTYFSSKGEHPGNAADCWTGKNKQHVAATGQGLADGWAAARWLRDNHVALKVRYVIWQNRIWHAHNPVQSGDFTVNPPNTAHLEAKAQLTLDDITNGHYDHIHVSVEY